MKHIAHLNKLYLSPDDLKQYDLSTAYFEWCKGRQNVTVIDHAEYGRVVDYDTIPTRSRAKLPTRSELVEMCNALSSNQVHVTGYTSLKALLHRAVTVDCHNYSSVYYGATGNEYRALDLAKAAAVLLVGANIKFSKKKGFTIEDYMIAVNDLELKELKFGKKINGEWQNMNARVAYRKIEAVKKLILPTKDQPLFAPAPHKLGIEKVVKTKREGNSNRRKVSKEVENIIAYINCFLGYGQLLPAQVWDRYCRWAETGGVVEMETGEVTTLPTLSISTVKNLLVRPDIAAMCTLVKHGEKTFNDYFMPYVSGKRPEFMLSVVGMDDEDAPFYLKVQGKNTWFRAKVVFIFDGATRRIVGYAIGIGAGHELYREAIRSMIRGDIEPATRGIMPAEVQLDHYTKGDKKEFEHYFKRINFGRAKNPQERYAERDIYDWETQYMRQIEGWIGLGIKTKRYQNRQQITVSKGYTLDEIDKIYRLNIPKYNGNKKSKPIQSKCERMPEQLIALYAGEWSIVQIKRGRIRLGFDNEYYEYEVPGFMSLKTLKVRAAWTENSENEVPSQIHLFYYEDKKDVLKDTYICTSSAVRKVNRAQIEQTDEDKENLGHSLNIKKASKLFVEQKIRELSSMNLEAMDSAAAEAILSAGYTDKEVMMAAELTLMQADQEKTHIIPDLPPIVTLNKKYQDDGDNEEELLQSLKKRYTQTTT